MRVVSDPSLIPRVKEELYLLASEAEKRADGSALRISYILSKQAEFLLVSRRFPETFQQWIKDNRELLFKTKAIAGLGAGAAYYLTHKSELDGLLGQFLAGLFRSESFTVNHITSSELDLKASAEELSISEPEIWEYVKDLVCSGLTLVSDEEAIDSIDH